MAEAVGREVRQRLRLDIRIRFCSPTFLRLANGSDVGWRGGELMTKQRFFKSFGGKAVSLTNLCTNGNFASTSGWVNSGMASFGVSGNVASATANSQYDVIR